MGDLVQHLTQLDRAGLVRLFAESPDLEYLFRHALVQDAAYASLLKSDRRRLHAQVGAVLESLDSAGYADLAALLGHHFHEAGNATKARLYFEQAADHALAIYSNAEAEGHYASALALTEDATARARILYGLGQARARQGRHAAAAEVWCAALTAYQAIGDLASQAQVYAALTDATFRVEDPRAGLRVCEEGWAAVGTQPDSLGLFALSNMMARVQHFNGLSEEAWDWAQRNLALARRLGNIHAEAEALLTLGTCGHASLDDSLQALERVIALATGADQAALGPLAAIAHQNIGVRFWEEGRLQQSRDHVAQAVALYDRYHLVTGRLFSAASLCIIESFLGNLPAARQALPGLLEEARVLHTLIAARTMVPLGSVLLARFAGRLPEVCEDLNTLLTRAWSDNDSQFIIPTSQALAEVLLEQGAAGEAQRVLTAVLPVCDQNILLGRVWPRARLAECAAALGDPDAAQRWLAEARRLAGPQPHLIDTESLALAAAALARAAGDWVAALAAYTQAATVEAAMGKRWYHAQTLRAAAAAHRARGQAGDTEAAHALLREALAIFTEVDVPYYVALVEAELLIGP